MQFNLAAHEEKHSAAYAPGVLCPEQHYKLVEALPRVCAAAGISEQFVTTSMRNHCSTREIEWVKRIRSQTAGLLYVDADDVVERMMAIAGACLRNYLEARVCTIGVLLSELKDRSHEPPRILLIPNFCTQRAQYGVAAWEATSIENLILSRYMQGVLTIVAASSLDDITRVYGETVGNHIRQKYTRI